MRKLQDLAKIISVEINDTLKEINREKDARGNWRTLIRLVVSFDVEEVLTDEQRAKLSRLTAEQKAFVQRTKRAFNVSNLFNASDVLPTSFETPEGGFDDVTQDTIVGKIKDYLSTIGNMSLFTCHTFAVNELCDFETLYDAENGTAIRERSYLSSGFADDDERIKNILSSQIAQQLEEGEITNIKPNVAPTEKEATPTATTKPMPF